jgi:hypothetical protein
MGKYAKRLRWPGNVEAQKAANETYVKTFGSKFRQSNKKSAKKTADNSHFIYRPPPIIADLEPPFDWIDTGAQKWQCAKKTDLGPN